MAGSAVIAKEAPEYTLRQVSIMTRTPADQILRWYRSGAIAASKTASGYFTAEHIRQVNWIRELRSRSKVHSYARLRAMVLELAAHPDERAVVAGGELRFFRDDAPLIRFACETAHPVTLLRLEEVCPAKKLVARVAGGAR